MVARSLPGADGTRMSKASNPAKSPRIPEYAIVEDGIARWVEDGNTREACIHCAGDNCEYCADKTESRPEGRPS